MIAPLTPAAPSLQLSEQDFGSYTCAAENEHGKQTSEIQLSGLPDAPVFTSDPNGGEEASYTLAWNTESYYPIQAYAIKFRKAKVKSS